MPTRLLHESLGSSPSLRQCSPRAQDAFPRFVLCADDFGCFEAAPRALIGKQWMYRDDVAETDIRAWLVEYASNGMLCIWDQEGRWWASFVRWAKFQRKRDEYSSKKPKGSKRKTPRPPTAQGDIRGFATSRLPRGREDFPGGKAAPESNAVTDALESEGE